mmetsp:Transcript_42554/g.120748  ORF Transcript_42554/g.120748 Transcript_42554/m.120748 type:complete len:219 (+) Transcript_42554:328-984(+)
MWSCVGQGRETPRQKVGSRSFIAEHPAGASQTSIPARRGARGKKDIKVSRLHATCIQTHAHSVARHRHRIASLSGDRIGHQCGHGLGLGRHSLDLCPHTLLGPCRNHRDLAHANGSGLCACVCRTQTHPLRCRCVASPACCRGCRRGCGARCGTRGCGAHGRHHHHHGRSCHGRDHAFPPSHSLSALLPLGPRSPLCEAREPALHGCFCPCMRCRRTA